MSFNLVTNDAAPSDKRLLRISLKKKVTNSAGMGFYYRLVIRHFSYSRSVTLDTWGVPFEDCGNFLSKERRAGPFFLRVKGKKHD